MIILLAVTLEINDNFVIISAGIVNKKNEKSGNWFQDLFAKEFCCFKVFMSDWNKRISRNIFQLKLQSIGVVSSR